MAPPPAKRQKRHVVLSSEDEDVPTPPSKTVKVPTRASTKDKSRLAHSNGVEKRSLPTRSRTKESSISKHRPGQTPSPERGTRKPVSKASANGPLYTFFKPASEAPLPQKQSKTENFPPAEEDVEEDIIEDDSAEETSRLRKPPTKSGKHGTTWTVLDRRKPLQEQTQNSTITASQEKPISASQRFLTVGKSLGRETSTQTMSAREAPDTRPWAERYGPTNLEDLMVHKKKVADVRGWLEGVMQGRNHKVDCTPLGLQAHTDGPKETPNTQGSCWCGQDSYSLSSSQSYGRRYLRVEEPCGYGPFVRELPLDVRPVRGFSWPKWDIWQSDLLER